MLLLMVDRERMKPVRSVLSLGTWSVVFATFDTAIWVIGGHLAHRKACAP